MDKSWLVRALGPVAGRRVFESSNRWGIPDLLSQNVGRSVLRLPLCRYPALSDIRSKGPVPARAVGHFFVDDGRFEKVWNRPMSGVATVRKYAAVLTPDFSLYRGRPLAEQIWNTYRSRWVGRFWQEHGLKVIPTVSWAEAESFRFCFEGIPTKQIVAIATFGVADRATRRFFIRGFERMTERLTPSGLIIYGIPPKRFALADLIPSTCRYTIHPHRWQQWRALCALKREGTKETEQSSRTNPRTFPAGRKNTLRRAEKPSRIRR